MSLDLFLDTLIPTQLVMVMINIKPAIPLMIFHGPPIKVNPFSTTLVFEKTSKPQYGSTFRYNGGVELVENGFNAICGSDKTKIILSFRKAKYEIHRNFKKELYGDGKAGQKIIDSLA